MKRVSSLLILLVGLSIGFLSGLMVNDAHSDPAKNDPSRVVAKLGEISITRGEVAEQTLAKWGFKALNEDLFDRALVEEIARRDKVIVTSDEVNKRVEEAMKFAESTGTLPQMKQMPSFLLFEQTRSMLLVEKMTSLKVTQAEARSFFLKNQQFFVTNPPQFKMICIATDTKEKAEKARRRLKNGDAPRTVSVELSTDEKLKNQKGDLGWFTISQMSPQVANAVAGEKKLKPKEYTETLEYFDDVTQTIQYLVFYVEDYKPGNWPSFDEVEPAAMFIARSDKYGQIAPAWFKANAQEIRGAKQWTTVKDFFAADAKLETGPVNLQRYESAPRSSGPSPIGR
ncbi:MAG: peptidylprolyl isomerase [Armatimonadota bacterium]